MPPKRKTETVVLDGEKVKFKKGALHRQLDTPDGYTFTPATLERLKRVENGKSFTFLKRRRTMTPLLKRRVSFALVLMGRTKKK